ncbi:TPA: RNA-binding transcriptional accessory protein [Staphylococcus aureus]|uniref:Tex-like N-terminal domain-containing protein n=1 Tax=Staphylococcus aureus TaxID=1280 RepID=UPI0004B36C49|nr:Tex family protein [Staphylococcus aureus]HDK8978330.1 RNA-binding transcriptional accessory protein [Staphylococcus aureus USA700-NRS386]EIB2250977.1 RNA-binding transcriptional accessory protein [Staphylococcus aureus]EKK3589985.1 RNA-binding transcriptional accessory protein [Staphylococcus aureus]ELP3500782.1 RNA-binding transcriptional accessory protein [Staphylococcus aureus]ELQ0889138.1 RNA-binding transcriptional accessory protein [Staphylococcus aureus]
MDNQLINSIIEKYQFSKKQIEAVLTLLEEKNTVPFIARYRKEQTGGLDEVQIKQIDDEYQYMVNLQKRKEEVIKNIEQQGLLTEELKKDILKQNKLQRVEDLYRPFKQKKKTRATEAKRKGLEPLAIWMKARKHEVSIEEKAQQFINEEVQSVEDAIKGAQDIIAEQISDNPKYRTKILKDMYHQGVLTTSKKKNAEDEKGIFEMYYAYSEPIKRIANHRVLAVNRGEKEKVLSVKFEFDTTSVEDFIARQEINHNNVNRSYILEAIKDSLKRLIVPSIEREIHADLIKKYALPVQFIIVNEAGASVYSASEIARDEFPDFQVEERSAVSIGRRVQDPLSELVKIDPKSIGVGQYQHDVNQKALENALTFVVETAVNQVGVDVNTASSSLLQYVSGLSSQIAKNIIAYREENGAIKHNKELSKIKRLGAKTFEQSIGFLRIVDGSEPLDNTSIHPESYKVTYQLLDKLGFGGNDLGSDALKDKLNSLDMDELAIELQVGVPTLEDIIKSLKAPNRDPRDEFETPILKSDVLSIEDLQEGMKLSGTVRNVVDFGAFVDIGVKQDGLVHVSKLSKKFVKNPMDIVSVGDIVDVWIYSIDKNKDKVSLTMIDPHE